MFVYVYARDSDASGIHNKSKIVPFHFLHQCLDLILVQFFQSLGNHRILIVLELFGLEGSEQWQSAKKGGWCVRHGFGKRRPQLFVFGVHSC